MIRSFLLIGLLITSSVSFSTSIKLLPLRLNLMFFHRDTILNCTLIPSQTGTSVDIFWTCGEGQELKVATQERADGLRIRTQGQPLEGFLASRLGLEGYTISSPLDYLLHENAKRQVSFKLKHHQLSFSREGHTQHVFMALFNIIPERLHLPDGD